jgi:hypothetical protein
MTATAAPSRSASEFTSEWAAIGAVALLDSVLTVRAGIHFHVSPLDIHILIPILFALAVAARRLGWPRTGLVLEYVSLMMAVGLALAVMTYACSALSGPWMDASLRAADRALGFDWLTWFHFITGHPLLGSMLHTLYSSLVVQVLYLALLRGLMGDGGRLRETFWVLLIGCLITCLGAWAAPALGPYDTYHLKQSYGQFVLELEHLHSGHDLNFALGGLLGVVDFPSFHSTMALALAYAFRGTGIIGWAIAAAEIVLLLAVPVYGGHYLVDVIAGIAVFALSLALVKGFSRLRAQGAIFAGIAASARLKEARS